LSGKCAESTIRRGKKFKGSNRRRYEGRRQKITIIKETPKRNNEIMDRKRACKPPPRHNRPDMKMSKRVRVAKHTQSISIDSGKRGGNGWW